MVQCEMCGAETSSPKTVKVEGATLDVCSDCTDFGTEIKPEGSSSSTSTKYSTSSGGSSQSRSTSTSGSAGSGRGTSKTSGRSRTPDIFDDVDELATDYDDRIRRAREDENLSQSELANELNEKASLIRKLERGETLPSDNVQSKLEGYLDISLTADQTSAEDTEWESGSETGSYTLGDVVKRKD